MNYYKILNKTEKHYKMQYKTGLNINCESFNPSGDCDPGGMYFSREDILAFLNYGPWIRKVTLCSDSKIYKNPGQPVKWKTNKFILGERREITADVIKELIEEGADAHVDNSCALQWASYRGYLEIVKLLVENGANIHADNDYPIKISAKINHLEVVKYLIKMGVDKNIPLYNAVDAGNLEIVEYLAKEGADIHYSNDYMLGLASYKGHLNIVKFLVNNGADIYAENMYALKLVSINGNLAIVRFLIEHCDINVKDLKEIYKIAVNNYRTDVVNYINNRIKMLQR